MQIRRDDVCADCGVVLAAGSSAYWNRAQRCVRCVACQAGSGGEPDPMVIADTAPPTARLDLPPPLDLPAPSLAPPTPADVAGGSAQLQYDKRSARERARKEARVASDAEWRKAIKEERPVLGRIVAAITAKPQIGPESQPTTAWKVGAQGEQRVAEVLTGRVGIEVLHDRLVPGSRAANIDHVVVGPAGVFVIDAKKYKGAIGARDVGGLFRVDLRLYVNGRDRTALVDGVLHQIDVVRGVLGDQWAHVPVNGVLCFIGCEWGVIMRAKHVKAVTALWPAALPAHVTASGPLAAQVPEIATHLRERLRSAPR